MAPDAITWSAPSQPPSLCVDEVHVWRAQLGLPSNELQTLWDTLDTGERRKADSFHFGRDRVRYIASHGRLREILSLCSGLEPHELAFQIGAHGKPALRTDLVAEDIRFNFSHSGQLAVYAIAVGRDVGIDVEAIRRDLSLDAIAERSFSRNEVCALRSLPRTEFVAGFFTCWTRKEAYIKALGTGLALELSQFDVPVSPRDAPTLLCNRKDPDEVQRWSFLELPSIPGYAAALLIEGSHAKPLYWDWPLP